MGNNSGINLKIEINPELPKPTELAPNSGFRKRNKTSRPTTTRGKEHIHGTNTVDGTMAEVANAHDGACYGKSFTRITQENEK